MTKKYVFDLDNTLVFTNDLNNKSYNYALGMYNKGPIITNKRITFEVIKQLYPDLSNRTLRKVRYHKQKYFNQNISNISMNIKLFNILEQLNPVDCVLWTSACKKRVKSILNHFNLRKEFKKIVFSSKLNIDKDIIKICKILNCKPNNLIIFEDDNCIINVLESMSIEHFDF